MEFWISGELDSEIAECFDPVRKVIEATLNERLGTNDYGDVLVKIALIPIVLGPRFQGSQRARRLVKWKEKVADYRLPIDFRVFRAGTERERKALLLENLLSAVDDIERKSKGKFQGKILSQDIRRVFYDVLGNR